MKIEIFSKSNCSHCKAAVQLAEHNGFSPTIFKLEEDFTKDELLARFPYAKTFPQIIVADIHVGGFREFSKLLLSLSLSHSSRNG